MKKFLMATFVPLILVSLSSGCAPVEETSNEEVAHSKENLRSLRAAGTGRSYLPHILGVRETPASGEIIVVTPGESEEEQGSLVIAQTFDGPSFHSLACTQKVVNGCVLETCSETQQKSADYIDIAPVHLEGPDAEATLPVGNPFMILLDEDSQPYNLWNNPGDFVRISYTDKEGKRIQTRQAAPARGLNVTQHLPAEVDRSRAYTIRWEGARPRDQGVVAVHIASTEDLIRDEHTGLAVRRYQLSCRQAKPKDGSFRLQSAVLSQLPPGNYVADVQPESSRFDSRGVRHILFNGMGNSSMPVVLQ